MAYTLTQWNLGELYPGFDSPDLQMAFDNVEEQVMSFEGIRGKLLPDIDSNQFMERGYPGYSLQLYAGCAAMCARKEIELLAGARRSAGRATSADRLCFKTQSQLCGKGRPAGWLWPRQSPYGGNG